MRPSADVSVLMPVYAGVEPRLLAQALAGIESQSVRPRELVVVVDGPVSTAHDAVLAQHPATSVVRLADRQGSGLARRRGLELCSSTWVALADADDVSEPQRLERQVETLARTGADVCSASMLECLDDGRELGVRGGPTEHAEFARLMRSRNPVNQPATMFRRQSALAAGSYRHLPYLEDYDLWARMLAGGAIFVGVAEPLVRFRVDGMLDRRTSPEALRSERQLQRNLRTYGIVGPVRATANLLLRSAYLRLPSPVLAFTYRLIFRRAALA